jgi:hypothetical protein
VAFWDLFDSQRNRIHIFAEKINQKKHTVILKWLKKRFQYFIIEYQKKSQIIQTEKNIPPIIWVCWWDGINTMPPIVKACYNSILKYAGGLTVTLITRDNFQDYIDIPDHVLEKAQTGIMTVTHFSNIIRMSLLAKYGGLWIDATILLTKPPETENCSFFTIKRKPGGEFVPKRRWTGNCIGGSGGTSLFVFVRDFLCEYWKYYDKMIDYFLYDYSIALAYCSLPQITQLIDNLKTGDQDFYILQDNLENEFDYTFFHEIIKNTTFHKLTWKKQYPIFTKNNKLTIYGYLINNFDF